MIISLDVLQFITNGNSLNKNCDIKAIDIFYLNNDILQILFINKIIIIIIILLNNQIKYNYFAIVSDKISAETLKTKAIITTATILFYKLSKIISFENSIVMVLKAESF